MRKHYICPMLFIDFQIQHYTDRLAVARNLKEKFFLRKELHNLKIAFFTYYN